ncbi:MAG TPA: hypothetical protein VN679_12315, partial [Candidatus Acidoferrales bacterium]|nr:hypothetical protein [Candidatus Acidoferrales bacterium]
MKERSYRNAFIAALFVAGIFALGAIYFWSQSRRPRAAEFGSNPVQSTAGEYPSQQTQSAPAAAPQVALAPVRLSPERSQSIGIKFATVQRKPVRDSIRATGTVDIDEERVAYVQTRFPGWIQKV